MKCILYHGDNIVASRTALTNLIEQYKKNGTEILRLENPSPVELLNTASNQSLFADSRLIVLENFLSNHKDGPDTLGSIRDTLGPDSDTSLLIWEKKSVTPAVVKKLAPYVNTQEFKLPTVLFAFLDNVYPKNTQKLIGLFRQALETADAEFLFVMLARQVRLMVWAALDPDTLMLAPWQKGKIVSQAKKFTSVELIALTEKLLKVDRDNKTSASGMDLASSLELLLATL